MIRMLLNHELLRTGKRLLQLFGGATLFTLAGSLLHASQLPVLAGLGLVVAGFATVALVPVVQLVLALDYWRSSYGPFGYFTQTIPVQGATIYRVKLGWAFLVSLAAVLWSLLNGLIIWAAVAFEQNLDFGFLFEVLGAVLWELAGVVPAWVWLAGGAFGLLFLGFGLFQYFFAVSIGNERGLRNRGFGGMLLTWFLVWLVLQAANALSIVAVPVVFSMKDDRLGFMRLDTAALFRDGSLPDDMMPVGFLLVFLVAAILLYWRTAVSWARNVHLS